MIIIAIFAIIEYRNPWENEAMEKPDLLYGNYRRVFGPDVLDYSAWKEES